MTNTTNTFSFAGLELRCVTIDGQPWFAAADVCRMIGAYVYGDKVNTYHALEKLDAMEKRILPTVEANRILLKTRGKFGFALVSEQGLYRLVLRSDKPQAREFQNWVTGTVLPAIREHGSYAQGEEKLDLTKPEDQDRLLVQLLESLRSRIATAEAGKAAAEANLKRRCKPCSFAGQALPYVTIDGQLWFAAGVRDPWSDEHHCHASLSAGRAEG